MASKRIAEIDGGKAPIAVVETLDPLIIGMMPRTLADYAKLSERTAKW
jgi:hypothetical protein